ncbi:hypothetical protein [Archangium lansingense]|uniref:Anti-sigma factor NepR domain-containing protein n=1 Tax=Archangium lansingense TaxID=2995310 RepID=A0ABT3ZXQ1_9BACT|nr:hypothetical protein [Archangium lansinium]MCY1073804.1 hypothetical protein [Archangium lansinium]
MREQRIAHAGREVLAARPADGDAEALGAWKLELEGVAREMDAGFAPEVLPEALRALRDEVRQALAPAPQAGGDVPLG